MTASALREIIRSPTSPPLMFDREKARKRLATVLGQARPFPWQLALLDRLLDGDIPTALDIPTGLGKTAVMPIWLVARAAGAAVPRRLVYVVDRRAVVDQATDVAEGLRKAVTADAALSGDLGLEQRALPISTLRGQHIDNREWLADPASCAIVLGTVDMIGSRLLFEGYGISRRMRPYHAGLLGADVLLVLDEAHLVPPFEQLIESIAQRCGAAAHDVLGPRDLDRQFTVPRFHRLSLSATGRSEGSAHRLTAADRADSVVARRLRAPKRISVREPVAPKDMPIRLADEVWGLLGDDAPRRCIVFCNSRDDAQKVHELLVARVRKEFGGNADVELLVGARRVWERTVAQKQLEGLGFIAGRQAAALRPACVVATAAGEVGVDLDAEHMVCDLVAWERMIQRLGRVNRRGDGDACVVVVPLESSDDEWSKQRDAAMAVLAALPAVDGAHDGSPEALVTLKERCGWDDDLCAIVERATTAATLHPPLTRAVVESWSMTSLDHHTGRPEVQPWIRGWIDEEPQTTLVWREHLPIRDDGRPLDRRALEAFRDAADPHLAERLETETHRALAWLSKRVSTAMARRVPTGDESGEGGPTAASRRLVESDSIVAVILPPDATEVIPWRAADVLSKEKRGRLQRDLEHAVLMIDARIGGLSAGLLEDDCETAQDLTSPSPDAPLPLRIRRTEQVDTSAPVGWRVEARIPVRHDEDGQELAWLSVESDGSAPAESEEGRSVAPNRSQLLTEHQEWAESEARVMANRLGLPRELAGVLALAARLHDEGKQSRRWQRAFGRTPNEEREGKVYAKTTHRPNVHLLEGYRHEIGSIPRAERDPRVRDLPADLRDLCLHLIAAHHGHARPLLRSDGADEPPTALRHRCQEIALRFCRLQDQWGPWGLAWWEALLRAADQQASKRNDQQEAARG